MAEVTDADAPIATPELDVTDVSVPKATLLSPAAVAANAAVEPPPRAIAFNPAALANEPNAVAFSPETAVFSPTAVAFLLDALTAQPTPVAFSPVTFIWRPRPIELAPVAVAKSPIAILMFLAVAPAPPAIAMELSVATAGIDEVSVVFCREVAASTGLIAPKDKTAIAAAHAPDVFKTRLRCPAGPLLVFLQASSEATTQQPSDVFQTTENILFIYELASSQPPNHVSSMA
nr:MULTISPECIES: hypothetical protein [unclassified Pseudomonas]